MQKLVSTMLALALAMTAIALPRDAQQKAGFRKANPCPSSGALLAQQREARITQTDA